MVTAVQIQVPSSAKRALADARIRLYSTDYAPAELDMSKFDAHADGEFATRAILAPFIARLGAQSLDEVIVAVAKSLGFESYSYYFWNSEGRSPTAWIHSDVNKTNEFDWSELGFQEVQPALDSLGGDFVTPWIRDIGSSADPLSRALRAKSRSGVSFKVVGQGAPGFGVLSFTSRLPDAFGAIPSEWQGQMMIQGYYLANWLQRQMEASKAFVVEDPEIKSLDRTDVSILQFAAKGLASKEIAPLISRTTRFVNYRFGEMFTKLHCVNRTEVVARAMRAGLIRA